MSTKTTANKVSFVSKKSESYEQFVCEFERPLLSCIINDRTRLIELRQQITSDYFLLPTHSTIYTALCNLADDSKVKTISSDLLMSECVKLGLNQQTVPPAYIHLVMESGFDPSNFDYYRDNVRESYLKYQLFKKIEEYREALQNTKKKTSLESLVQGLSEDISRLYTFDGLHQEAVSVADRAADYVHERALDPGSVKGLKTGFETLDNAINGLMPGTLTIIAGMAKAGKSTVMTNIVDYVAIESENPVPVLVISTEMYTDEDISRLISMRSLVEERKIANGTAYNDPKLAPVIEQALEQIKSAKIYHIYMPDFNAVKITNLIHYYKLKYDIGFAVFDYIKMETTGDTARDKREDQVLGDITTALKNCAGKLHIPILTACQINTRTGRIADSDRIVRYANTLIEFKRKTLDELTEHDPFRYGTHWLRVFATRSGGNCLIPIRFWQKCLKMYEAELLDESIDDDSEVNQILNAFTTPAEYQKMTDDSFRISSTISALEKVDTSEFKVLDNQSDFPINDDDLF